MTNIDTQIGFLRQWLNEDRIQDPKKMVTNDELKHWLAPILTRAEAGGELAKSIVKDVDCKLTDHELSSCPKCYAVHVYLEAISATQDSVREE